MSSHELDRRPPIRALSGAPPVEIADNLPELAKRAINYGNQVAVMPHDPLGLLRFLHLKLHESARIRQRAKWPGGAFWNYAFGEGEADYIHCAGSHLRQVLDLIGIEPPANLQRGGQYALSVDWAQMAYDRLREDTNLAPHRF